MQWVELGCPQHAGRPSLRRKPMLQPDPIVLAQITPEVPCQVYVPRLHRERNALPALLGRQSVRRIQTREHRIASTWLRGSDQPKLTRPRPPLLAYYTARGLRLQPIAVEFGTCAGLVEAQKIVPILAAAEFAQPRVHEGTDDGQVAMLA